MAGSEKRDTPRPEEGCDRFRELVAGHLDRELTPAETEELRRHLERCEECRDELRRQERLKEVMDTMRLPDPPPELWDRYWLGVYNRMERGLAWILLSVAALVLICAGGYEMFRDFFQDPEVPLIVRIGVGCGATGMAVLFISVLRERVFLRKRDRYREVVR